MRFVGIQSRPSPMIEDDNLEQLAIASTFVSNRYAGGPTSYKALLGAATHTNHLRVVQFVLPPPPSLFSLLIMSTSLPSATSLMNHADDPRHITYSTWIIPHFFPYMRDLLFVLHDDPAWPP